MLLVGFCSKSPFLITLVSAWTDSKSATGRLKPSKMVKPEMTKADKMKQAKVKVVRTLLVLDAGRAIEPFSSINALGEHNIGSLHRLYHNIIMIIFQYV